MSDALTPGTPVYRYRQQSHGATVDKTYWAFGSPRAIGYTTGDRETASAGSMLPSVAYSSQFASTAHLSPREAYLARLAEIEAEAARIRKAMEQL